jgi:hypothetical protein
MTLHWVAARTAVLVVIVAACGGGATPTSAPQPTSALAPTDDVDTFGPETEAPEPTNGANETGGPRPTDQANDIGTDRPSHVTLTIAGTAGPGLKGAFTGSGMTRLCGNFTMALSGDPRGFDYGFPKDIDQPQVDDVTFHAQDLLPGATTTSFSVSVNVITSTGASPPTLAISPDTEPGHSGSASRSELGGTTTLTVNAVDDLGVTLNLTATCGPR